MWTDSLWISAVRVTWEKRGEKGVARRGSNSLRLIMKSNFPLVTLLDEPYLP